VEGDVVKWLGSQQCIWPPKSKAK